MRAGLQDALASLQHVQTEPVTWSDRDHEDDGAAGGDDRDRDGLSLPVLDEAETPSDSDTADSAAASASVGPEGAAAAAVAPEGARGAGATGA